MVRIVGFSRFAVEQNRFAVYKAACFFVGRCQTGFHQSLNHVEALGNFKSWQAVECQLLEVAFGEIALVFGKQAFRNALGGSKGFFAVNQTGHFLCKNALRFWFGAAGFIFRFDGIDFFDRQEGKVFQEFIYIGIGYFQPELVELIRRSFLRVQPYCAAFGFAEFGAV